ncbi:MAG: type II toxin-antitoxin system VapC family toxin [bacterium]|nr:type II toxin-antitoxin system VapC family toxin [bacterium]
MIVVDASVMVNAIADNTSDGGRARTALLADPDLAAPDLISAEVVSVLRKWWQKRHLSDENMREAIANLTELDVAYYPTLPLMSRAYELRANLTPYDAAYAALAEMLDCPLLTADARMANAPGPNCEFRVIQPSNRQ